MWLICYNWISLPDLKWIINLAKRGYCNAGVCLHVCVCTGMCVRSPISLYDFMCQFYETLYYYGDSRVWYPHCREISWECNFVEGVIAFWMVSNRFYPFSTILTHRVHLFKFCAVTFCLFWHEASPGWYQWTVKMQILLNRSKGYFQGQVWLIFTYFSILIGSIKVLPKCIAPFQGWS